MSTLNEKITFSLSNSSSKNYVVANINNKNVIDYQIEVINNLDNGQLLGIDKRQFNLDIQLFYETSQMVTLKEFFESNKLNKQQFIQVLSSLSNGILNAEEHYLTSNNYVFDIDKIYIDELQVKFIYLPLEECWTEDVNNTFEKLIKKIIVDYADVEELANDNYIQRILNFFKNQTVTIDGFCKFINEEVKVSTSPKVYKPKENVDLKNYNNCCDHVQQNQPINEDEIIAKSEYIKKSVKSDKTKGNEKNRSTTEKIKEVYKTSNIIIAVVMQGITLMLCISSFLFLKSFEVSEKFGVILLLGAIDFLITKFALDKKKKVKIKVSKKANKETPKLKEVEENVQVKGQTFNNSNETVNNKSTINSNPPSINLSKREMSTEDAFETELLNTNYPFLLSDKCGAFERIYISKDVFKLGRLSSEVDYTILNKAVGKVHAEIENNRNEYLLVDLNSKNGTFINGQRLAPNRQYSLKENDVITFANENYTFKMY